jgi:hypothetical protein
VTIVTEKTKSKSLEQQIGSSDWTLHDIVLDDGTWLPDTMVVDDPQEMAIVVRDAWYGNPSPASR